MAGDVPLRRRKEQFFLSLIQERRGIIYNTSKIPDIVKLRNEAWKEITEVINQKFGENRTVVKVQNLWRYMKRVERLETEGVKSHNRRKRTANLAKKKQAEMEEAISSSDLSDVEVEVQGLYDCSDTEPANSGNVSSELADDLILPEHFPLPKQIVANRPEILNNLKNDNEGIRYLNLSSSAKTNFNGIANPSSINSVFTDFNRTSLVLDASKSNFQRMLQFKQSLENGIPFLPNIKQNTPKAKYTMAQKMEMTAPYNLFYNAIPAVPETLNEVNTITFSDLLCPSLGELQRSLQLNYIIDVSWMLEQYEVHNVHDLPVTILYGHTFPHMDAYIKDCLPNVTHKLVIDKRKREIRATYKHYSKIGVYVYTDGSLRVVVSTANLRHDDWNHYNQGIWISPLCPPLPMMALDREGESRTLFKWNLLNYLKNYNLPILDEWISYVKRANFSTIKVCLVTSFPGTHICDEVSNHKSKVQDILTKYCNIPHSIYDDHDDIAWSINTQVSHIGALGNKPEDWLLTNFIPILASTEEKSKSIKDVKLNIIYPKMQNVRNSQYGGDCLTQPKGHFNYNKGWIYNYLYEWSAERTSRTKIMPGLSTYCRISPCKTKLAWFLMTTAPLSPKAWGRLVTTEGDVHVSFYDAGVMFLPSFFGQEYFDISENNSSQFPFIYDPTLKKYLFEDGDVA